MSVRVVTDNVSDIPSQAVESRVLPESIFPRELIYRSKTTLVIGTHTGPGFLLIAVPGDRE